MQKIAESTTGGQGAGNSDITKILKALIFTALLAVFAIL